MTWLVLFDIDGTLLWTGGAGKTALKLALEHVYGTSGALDQYDTGGRTVHEIVRGVLLGEGFTESAIHHARAAFYAVLAATLSQMLDSGTHKVEPCPGTRALVRALSGMQEVVVGLLTGNSQATSHLKLKAAGFEVDHFIVGAYGDESDDRRILLRSVVERAQQLTQSRFVGQAVVVIGDTVRDVTTAKTIGARAVAVATGGSSIDALSHSGADAVFEDFSDTAATLDAILKVPE